MPHKWDEEEEKSVIRKARVMKYGLRNRQLGESIEGTFEVFTNYNGLVAWYYGLTRRSVDLFRKISKNSSKIGRGRGMAAGARGAIGAGERLSQFLRNGLRVCMRETSERDGKKKTSVLSARWCCEVGGI